MNWPRTLTLIGAGPIWPRMKSVFVTNAAAKRRRRRSRETARARIRA
jgi:hypothetical protein